jgi:mRNA export factor
MIPVDEYKNDLRPDQSVTPFPDSISSLAWSPIGNRIFATTSWGGELRAYEIFQTDITQRIAYKFALPALKCCWNDAGNQLFVGLMDGAVKCYDIASGQVADIGKQGAAISSLHFLSGLNAVVSSGYESTVQVWRLGTPGPALTFNAENKVLATDVVFPTLVACTANERILIGDIANPTHRSIVESSDLGKSSQIQSVALNGKGVTMGVGSFDGRANISTIARNVHQNFVTKSTITFKSNKQE